MPYLPGLLLSVSLPPQQATVDPHLHQRLPNTQRQFGWVSCGVTAPLSWVLVCTRFCLCPPRVSVSPVLWKFCNQILLTFKVRFPGDSQSLRWIPRLGSLLWGLEFSQQCRNFFGVIVLQFVDRLPGGSVCAVLCLVAQSCLTLQSHGL